MEHRPHLAGRAERHNQPERSQLTDHLKTPVLALNKAGETTWKENYEAFGKAIINPASTAQINLRLPG